jgi:hypothetical protein
MLSLVEWRLLVLWVLACTAIGGSSRLPTLPARRAVQATRSGDVQYHAARNTHRAVAMLSLVPGVTAIGPNLNCVQDPSSLTATVVVPQDPSSLTATVVVPFVVVAIAALYFWIRGASTQDGTEARWQQRLDGMNQDGVHRRRTERRLDGWRLLCVPWALSGQPFHRPCLGRRLCWDRPGLDTGFGLCWESTDLLARIDL